jgi:hypothetical protein
MMMLSEKKSASFQLCPSSCEGNRTTKKKIPPAPLVLLIATELSMLYKSHMLDPIFLVVLLLFHVNFVFSISFSTIFFSIITVPPLFSPTVTFLPCFPPFFHNPFFSDLSNPAFLLPSFFPTLSSPLFFIISFSTLSNPPSFPAF